MTQWLEAATARLVAMLEAYDAHQKALALSASDEDAQLKIMRVGDLRSIPPRWRSRMDRAAKDGVRESLHASIREEGWAAYAQGGLDAMHALLAAVESHPKGSNRYGARLDKLWDNIGGKDGMWVA